MAEWSTQLHHRHTRNALIVLRATYNHRQLSIQRNVVNYIISEALFDAYMNDMKNSFPEEPTVQPAVHVDVEHGATRADGGTCQHV